MTEIFGTVVLAAGGIYSSKPRPVLVFQNDRFPTGESMVIIPFTSQKNPDAHYRVAVVPTKSNGLDRLCWLEIDKVGAIRATNLGQTIGRLDSDSLAQANKLIGDLLSPTGEEQ